MAHETKNGTAETAYCPIAERFVEYSKKGEVAMNQIQTMHGILGKIEVRTEPLSYLPLISKDMASIATSARDLKNDLAKSHKALFWFAVLVVAFLFLERSTRIFDMSWDHFKSSPAERHQEKE